MGYESSTHSEEEIVGECQSYMAFGSISNVTDKIGQVWSLKCVEDDVEGSGKRCPPGPVSKDMSPGG